MSEIRFYHLTTRSIDQALPDILQKALLAGHRVVVRTRDDAEAEKLTVHLWAYRADNFLPHGNKKDGRGEGQPIWLTPGNDVPNNATVVMILNGSMVETETPFTLCCDMFDGRSDEQVAAARARWSGYKNSGHTLTYWQQSENGWEQKAG